MKINVNNKEMDVSEHLTVSQLLQQLEISADGIAIGVNNRITPKQEWSTFLLNEHDSLVIIKAACGG